VDDVGGDERIVRVAHDAVERTVRSLPVGIVHLVDRHVAPDANYEVGDRAGRDGRTNRDSVHLPFQVRHDEADRARSARRRRNQVDRGSAGAPQVLVREIEDLLVVRVRVDRRHEALLDGEGVM
jgi:hypothetical protein